MSEQVKRRDLIPYSLRVEEIMPTYRFKLIDHTHIFGGGVRTLSAPPYVS
jgi:hypothetical protein